MTSIQIDTEVTTKLAQANNVKSETVATCDEVITLLGMMNDNNKGLVAQLKALLGQQAAVSEAIKAEVTQPKVVEPKVVEPKAAAPAAQPKAKAPAAKKTGELSRLRAGKPSAVSVLLLTMGNMPNKEGRAKDLAEACAAEGGPSEQYIPILFSTHKDLFEWRSRGLYGLTAEGKAELRKLLKQAAPHEEAHNPTTGTIPEGVLRRRANPAAQNLVATGEEGTQEHDTVELSSVFHAEPEPTFQANPFQMV